MSTSTRNRIIASLLAMFEAEHGSTPMWLIELHHRSDDEMLLSRLSNWRLNYPHHFAQHGIFVMWTDVTGAAAAPLPSSRLPKHTQQSTCATPASSSTPSTHLQPSGFASIPCLAVASSSGTRVVSAFTMCVAVTCFACWLTWSRVQDNGSIAMPWTTPFLTRFHSTSHPTNSLSWTTVSIARQLTRSCCSMGSSLRASLSTWSIATWNSTLFRYAQQRHLTTMLCRRLSGNADDHSLQHSNT